MKPRKYLNFRSVVRTGGWAVVTFVLLQLRTFAEAGGMTLWVSWLLVVIAFLVPVAMLTWMYDDGVKWGIEWVRRTAKEAIREGQR